MKEFENKVALVTGGSSGIGRATAIAFAREGAKVVVAARRVKEGEETVRLIKEAGSDGIFIQTDVTLEQEVQNLIEKTIGFYGRLDFAFNNAGVAEVGPITEATVDIYEKTFDVNVKGVLLCMKHEILQMLQNGCGSIVNTASIAGLIGNVNFSIYTASKHAVLGLTKATALEVAKSNIRVNAVCPGIIDTDMTRPFFDDPQYKQRMEMYPMGRIGQAEEVATAVVYLCSDKASFITGHSLAIDGGYTVQ